MHRFFIPRRQIESDGLRLTGSEAHHGFDVLRLRESDRAVVFDGEGNEHLCRIIRASARQIDLAELSKQHTPHLPFRVTLAQAVPKGKSMDAIVQKATELGVHRIIPVQSERTVVRFDNVKSDDREQPPEAEVDRKRDRWRDIAVEAAKQSGNNWLPGVEIVHTVKQVAAEVRHFDLALIGSLQPDAKFLRFYLDEFEAEQRRLPQSVLICIGPEGDYTPAEISLFLSAGCRPMTLGQIVLKSDTAAVYSLATLAYELQTRAVEIDHRRIE